MKTLAMVVRLAHCLLFGVTSTLAACDQGAQERYIATQDFQFAPSEVHISANQPTRLIIRNEGRERHTFDSPLLNRAAVRLPQRDASLSLADQAGIGLLPGQSLQLQFTPEPGMYEIRCLIKGHTGMRGMVIVEG